MFRARFQSAAATVLETAAFLSLSMARADAATGEPGPILYPLTGWLIGVLIVLVISLLSRHRPSKFGRHQAKQGSPEN